MFVFQKKKSDLVFGLYFSKLFASAALVRMIPQNQSLILLFKAYI
jgi:hypothetical protein